MKLKTECYATNRRLVRSPTPGGMVDMSSGLELGRSRRDADKRM